MNQFSINLAHLRKISGEDLDGFAKKIGVSKQQLKFFEQGYSEPEMQELIQISDHLFLPLDVLLKKDLSSTGKMISNAGLPALVIFDVDGVMTDGGLYYTEKGDRMKRYNVKDGVGIKRLLKENIEVGFLSGNSHDNIIRSRATDLGVSRIQTGVKNKLEVLEAWTKELKIDFNQVVTIGDDVPDLPLIEKCGRSFAPFDAAREVKNKVDIVLNRGGGEGCVREMVDEHILTE